MNTPRTFAEWLTWTREDQGYSKNALANRSGVNRSHLYKMESGEIAEPAEDTRQRLHAVFGTSDDDLVQLGILEGRTYQRAHGPVTVYEYVKRPLIPPAQEPGAASGDDAAFFAALADYLPALGPAQRRHLIESARMMTDAAIRRASSPAASPGPAREAAPDPPGTPSSR